MKKIITLFFCLSTFMVVNAQSTITTAELPFAGLAWTNANDTNYYDPILPGGANVTWDYSGLINQFVDTAGFVNATGTPYASNYPSSNLAAHNLATDAWAYYSSNSTGFYQNGFSDNTGNFILLSPALIAPVPFTFGNTRSNTARISIDTAVSGQNVRVAINVQSHFEADGYGTVILPNGTHNDVLRVKVTEITYDSISVAIIPGLYVPFSNSASQVTHFRYFKSGVTASYILNIDADSLGQFATTSAYMLQSAVLSAPEANATNQVLPYPNPASEYLYFSNALPNTSVTMISMDGKSVRLPLSSNGKNTVANVSGLTDGIYFYHYQSSTGLTSGKISIHH